MLHSDHPLQALLYSVVLHRFLRWRQPGYRPQRHLGGILYLFIRGMCGADTPVSGAIPPGVRLAPAGRAGRGTVRSARRTGGGGVSATVSDPADWRRSVSASGPLGVFNAAGVLDPADVLVAQRLTALARTAAGGQDDENVALAVAFAVRAVRGGSVCLDLAGVEEQVGISGLPWPEPSEWLRTVSQSALVTDHSVLHVDSGLLYLDRYWIEEHRVADDVASAGARRSGPPPDIGRLFPDSYAEQRGAAEVALSRALTVLTGGPGTGKTTTVARLLALLAAGRARGQTTAADRPAAPTSGRG